MNNRKISKLISKFKLPETKEDNEEILKRLSSMESITNKKVPSLALIIWVILQGYAFLRDIMIGRSVAISLILLLLGVLIYIYVSWYAKKLTAYIHDL